MLPGAAGAGKPGDRPSASAGADAHATGAHVKPGNGRGGGRDGGAGNGAGGRNGGDGPGGGGRGGRGNDGGAYSPSTSGDSGSTDGGGRQGASAGARGYAAPGDSGRSGKRDGRRSSGGSGSSGGGSSPSGGGSSPSGGGSSPSGGGSRPSGGGAPTTAAGAGSAPSPTASTGSSNEPRGTQRRRTSAAKRRAAAADRRRARRGSGDRGRRAARSATPARTVATVASRTLAAVTGAPGATSPADDARTRGGRTDPRGDSPVVVRTFRRIVEVIPTFIKAVIAALAVALMIASAAWFLLARNARFLRRQREKLVGEIGVLQGALLPNVPPELNRLEASVAYRPAEGLAAGGDFYDAFPLDHGHVGIVVGDVAGHGKDALMHTALLRYTMRAYLEAGLEPRSALQVAGRVLDRGFDTLATVVLAVYDPDRHVLRYATAGHPPPVFLGEADHVPVTRSSSPPIGAMLPTGLRQTTVSLPAGSAVCFFTDGLIEARRDGGLIGRLGLVDIIRRLGPHAHAAQLLDTVAAEADHVGDDMAACMFRVPDGPSAADAPARLEELELSADEPVAPLLGPFLVGCGLGPESVERRVADAERVLMNARAAIVRVSFGRVGPPEVSIAPSNVESLAAAHAVRAAV